MLCIGEGVAAARPDTYILLHTSCSTLVFLLYCRLLVFMFSAKVYRLAEHIVMGRLA